MAPQPPPRKPPGIPRPTGSVGRPKSSSGVPAPTPSPSRSKASSDLAQPPIVPLLVSVAIVVLVVFAVLAVSRESVVAHLGASAIGMFGSVVVLGWFRQSLNVRRSTGSFAEWSGPWESTRYMWLLVSLAWLGGAFNVYFAVYELVRPK